MGPELRPRFVERFVVVRVGAVDGVARVRPAAPPRAVEQLRGVEHFVLPADDLGVATARNASRVECSLRLSRACLGKSSVLES